MLDEKTINEYAKLVVKIGVNLQSGQGLEISCPIEKKDFALALTKAGYLAGASIVRVRWSDEDIDKLTYTYAETKELTNVSKWLVDSKNELVEKNFCYIAVSADNPEAFKDIPSEKLFAVAKAKSLALKKYSDSIMSNAIRWCIVSVPTKEWAKKVFPNSKTPEQELSNQIERAMRLDAYNPIEAWKEHIETLNKRAEFLNEQSRFKPKPRLVMR